jgi:hypothetical protein
LNLSGEFAVKLDLGKIGSHDAMIEWAGERADSGAALHMVLTHVTVDLGGNVIDVIGLLSGASLDLLKAAAWQRFPATVATRTHDSDTDFFCAGALA